MSNLNAASLFAEIEARSTDRHLREWGEQFAAFGNALVSALASDRSAVIRRFGELKLSLAQDGRRLVEFGAARLAANSARPKARSSLIWAISCP